MHYIQKHILDELRTTDAMRYAQLNRDGVESGHFRYHLTQLMNDGYIAQLERGLYALSISGQQYVDKLSAGRTNAMIMPKVITYTLLRDGNSIILQEKQKQPYMYLLNMVGGKQHEGETSQQAAKREVKEKTGNDVSGIRLTGIFEIITARDDVVFTHVVAYVYIAEVRVVTYTAPSLHVIALPELTDATNLAPDCLEIINRVKDASRIQAATLKINL